MLCQRNSLVGNLLVSEFVLLGYYGWMKGCQKAGSLRRNRPKRRSTKACSRDVMYEILSVCAKAALHYCVVPPNDVSRMDAAY
jgi:hypothetical protein